mmetsp:Transcript_39756/g.78313  ORF Transcript_39756/g.78313 Transcript_39756/m.78313 type:complete len:82 (-) Transcript_39756:499-744(-)
MDQSTKKRIRQTDGQTDRQTGGQASKHKGTRVRTHVYVCSASWFEDWVQRIRPVGYAELNINPLLDRQRIRRRDGEGLRGR